MERKSLSKKIRIKVYHKYNCHCSYCGCDLEYNKMQVDHLVSVRYFDTGAKKEIPYHNMDDLKNLMPSCRLCNYHKSVYSLEEFRRELVLKIDRVLKDSNTRLLEAHKLIKFNRNTNYKFYFERLIIEN